jgi:hypothetical protein
MIGGGSRGVCLKTLVSYGNYFVVSSFVSHTDIFYEGYQSSHTLSVGRTFCFCAGLKSQKNVFQR